MPVTWWTLSLPRPGPRLWKLVVLQVWVPGRSARRLRAATVLWVAALKVALRERTGCAQGLVMTVRVAMVVALGTMAMATLALEPAAMLLQLAVATLAQWLPLVSAVLPVQPWPPGELVSSRLLLRCAGQPRLSWCSTATGAHRRTASATLWWGRPRSTFRTLGRPCTWRMWLIGACLSSW